MRKCCLLAWLSAMLWCVCSLAQPSAGIIRKYHLSYSGISPSNVVASPTFDLDFSQAVAGTIVANTGQTLTVHGSPARVTDGTWPSGVDGAQGYAWRFGGSSEYISSTIGPPAGDFSVVCVVTPSATPGDVTIIGHYDGASSARGWRLYQSTTAAGLSVSDDGSSVAGHQTEITVANALAIGRTSIIIATYDYVSDGSSVMKLYADKLAAGTNTSADGPVYAGAYNMSIGAGGTGDTPFSGEIAHCSYWDGTVISADQASSIINTWLGILSSTGVPVAATSATPPSLMVAPPSSGTEPFLRNFGANLNTISNNGYCSGLYGPSAATNYIRRSLFRTWNGVDGGTGCGNYPTGWAASCSAGDGTASLAPDTTTKAVDLQSAKMTLTGTTSAAYLFSNCRSDHIGEYVRATTWYKCASGTCSSSLFFRMYTTASNCTGAYTDISTPCTGTSWTKCIFTLSSAAWAGGTQSYRIMLAEGGDGGVVSNWSAPQLLMSPSSSVIPTDHFCGTDADSDAVCSTFINSTPSPYSVNGPMTTTMTACSPWAGTEQTNAGYLLGDGGTTANGILVYVSPSIDRPVYFHNGSTGNRYVAASDPNWSAMTPYAVKFGHDGSGNLRLWWNNSWQTAMNGSGTGIRDAAQPTTYICGPVSYGSDMYIKDLVIYRRVIP